MDLKDKIVLVTGGARVGRTVADRLAERGAHLVLTYLKSKTSARETATRAAQLGIKTLLIQSDLTKTEECKKVIADIEKTFGGLDALIHMTSIYEETPFNQIDPEAWNRNMDVHLKSAFDMARLSAPLLRQNGQGRMIFISDWTCASSRPRYKGFLPYYVSKGGLIHLIEALALELAPEITVNGIAPGPILPPTNMNADEQAEVINQVPLKKWGGAEEIAKTALFLLESDFMTGECIRIDGGRHLY